MIYTYKQHSVVLWSSDGIGDKKQAVIGRGHSGRRVRQIEFDARYLEGRYAEDAVLSTVLPVRVLRTLY